MAGPPKTPVFPEWDYLIVTASNDLQAEAYRRLIELRRSVGFLPAVKDVLVVPDPRGRRIGSGGSTVHCLIEVLNLESRKTGGRKVLSSPAAWKDAFERLRILIVHAGGDSKRLPPYGPCGKIFVPVPGESGGALGTTLFDRLIPTYLRLPSPREGGGHVVVASGDVLLDFDAEAVEFAGSGITGLGAVVSPEVARNHGVYRCGSDGRVLMFLQKPSIARQADLGAVGPNGKTVLDIGVLSFAPAAAARLLEICGAGVRSRNGPWLGWGGPVAEAVETAGLDLYREFLCALGGETTSRGYLEEVRRAGSCVAPEVLRPLYLGLRPLPFHVHVVPRLRFLHFGTLRELIESGGALLGSGIGGPDQGTPVVVNSKVGRYGDVRGGDAWVEGCRIDAPLALAGGNILVGVDVERPLALGPRASLDVIAGRSRAGRPGWFVRAYASNDVFHRGLDEGARLGDLPVRDWLAAMGAVPGVVWDKSVAEADRTVWNGRFFPYVRDKKDVQDWLFLLRPRDASAASRKDWLASDRYSLEDMAARADLDSFEARRTSIRAALMREGLARAFGPESDLSAAELAYLLGQAGTAGRKDWTVAVLRQAARSFEASRKGDAGLASLEPSRILHTLGTALEAVAGGGKGGRTRGLNGGEIAAALATELTVRERRSLAELGLPLDRKVGAGALPARMKEAAFRHLGRTIVRHDGRLPAPPRNVLRSDEIVWGRAPARLDLGGGWTDTPPYSLERGGSVINAAVTLNGQAPIQAYARVIGEREIRINSIDHSTRVVVRDLDELLDYREPASQFGLAKAALALAGFAPGAAAWPSGTGTLERMLERFGGGIELTTLAAIPSGSGLGTSSIMGAVLMSVVGRMVGRPLEARELFHAVLQLEQELTTGGGWQDQIGGAVEGVKMIESGRGLVPDPRIRFVPADLLDPAENGGRTLLYYTGLRRLAKNILHEVVGRYLDRDRGAMETLRRLHAFPPLMAEALAMRDAERFGELIDLAWRLNVDLDPDHSTPVIEELRETVRPRVLGAKLLGAGGGGFLLMVCRSPEDAAAVRVILERRPPNDKARFFDFAVSRTGLVVTVC